MKIKNDLGRIKSLKIEIPALEENLEGNLCGGFCSINSSASTFGSDGVCDNGVCPKIVCPKGYCPDSKCECPPPTTTPAPNKSTTTTSANFNCGLSSLGLSMLF